MISFEWLEFETLSREVADLEQDVRAAKETQNYGRWKVLEQQLSSAKERRDKALEAITRRAASAAVERPPKSRKGNQPAKTAAVEDTPVSVETPPAAEPDGAAATEPAPAVASIISDLKGADIMWERFSPDDLKLAKQDLTRRRAEMLARHAEELKTLEADQEQIDTVCQAIEVFMSKFRGPSDAEVVQLDQQREARTA